MISAVSWVYKMDRISLKQDDRSLNFRPPPLLRAFRSLMSFLSIGLAMTISPLGNEHQTPLKRFEFTEPIMGTTARIVLYAPDEQLALEASRTAFERMTALENMLSDYRPESELNQLCRDALGSPKPVSPDLFEVLWESQTLAEKTGGAFDVTVGPVVQLWRRARRQKELPTPDRLAEARNLWGTRNYNSTHGLKQPIFQFLE